MSIKQAGKGRWQVRVARVNRRTGRRENRKATVKGPRAEAERIERELEAALDAGATRPRRVQLRTFATSWLVSRAESLKPGTRAKYATSLQLHILPALGDLYLDSIRPSDVKEYVSARTRDAAGNTVLNELRCLRTIAKDSVAEGLADADWCARVAAPEVATYTAERPNLLRADQLGAMLRQVPKQWLGIVTLIGLTGLRWGEASALRWEDLESFQVNGQTLWAVRIRRGNWKGTEVTPKTVKSVRSVPVPAIVTALLGPRRTRGLLFPTAKGKLHRGSPLRSVIERACRAAEVPRITTHGLRRTWNDLARRVASREVVKAVTGHATDAMLEHYSLVDMGEKAAAVDRVLALLAPAEATADRVPIVSLDGDAN